MKKNTIRLAAAMLLILSFALSLCGCGAQDPFLNAVKSGNYTRAIDYYQRKIAGNSRDELAAQQALESYLNQSWTAYASGTLSSEDFGSVFRCLEAVNDSLWILPEINWLGYEYETVEASKASFENGKAYAADGNYAAALSSFEQVIPEDSENYEKAVAGQAEARSAYIAAIRQEAEALAASGLYEDAMGLIADGESVLGWCDELQQLQVTLATEHYSTAMNQAYAEGDTLETVRLYEEAFDNLYAEPNAEMTRMYSECKSAYVRSVTDGARAAFENGRNYEAACAVIRGAIGEASFSAELLAQLEPLLEEYTAYAPVPLTSLTPVRQGEYIEIGDRWTSSDTYTDVNGTVYDSGNMIYPMETGFSLGSESPKTEDEAALVYVLNYQYSTLSGKVIRPYGSFSCDDWSKKDPRIRIYGDGVLLFESDAVTQNTWDAVPFQLDVSGVRELRIVAKGRWVTGAGSVGIYERHPLVCAADLMLQK